MSDAVQQESLKVFTEENLERYHVGMANKIREKYDTNNMLHNWYFLRYINRDDIQRKAAGFYGVEDLEGYAGFSFAAINRWYIANCNMKLGGWGKPLKVNVVGDTGYMMQIVEINDAEYIKFGNVTLSMLLADTSTSDAYLRLKVFTNDNEPDPEDGVKYGTLNEYNFDSEHATSGLLTLTADLSDAKYDNICCIEVYLMLEGKGTHSDPIAAMFENGKEQNLAVKTSSGKWLLKNNIPDVYIEMYRFMDTLKYYPPEKEETTPDPEPGETTDPDTGETTEPTDPDNSETTEPTNPDSGTGESTTEGDGN